MTRQGGSQGPSRRQVILGIAAAALTAAEGKDTPVGRPLSSAPHPLHHPRPAPATAFLTRQGQQLYRYGSPYRYVGVDAYDLATYEGNTYSAADLDAFFQAVRPATVTRFWATKLASVAAVDQVVNRAAANGQMVLPSLIDGQNFSNAAGDTVDGNFILMTGATWASYTGWIDTITSRYAGNPAIAAWELGNELDGGGGTVTPAQMAAFMETAGARVKGNDPGRLTASGLSGSLGAAADHTGSPLHWQTAQDTPSLDICSIHEYQYDQTGNTGASTSWAAFTTAAANLGKPVITGETGALLDQPNDDLCHDAAHTIDWLAQQKFDAYMGNGASGVNVWNWMRAKPSWVGTTCTANQHFFYGTGSAVLTLTRNYVLP